MVWKCIRVYDPERRSFSRGKLGEKRDLDRGVVVHKKVRGEKNWKLLGGRSAKIVRARQLAHEEYGLIRSALSVGSDELPDKDVTLLFEDKPTTGVE
jgi:hypothetical protein